MTTLSSTEGTITVNEIYNYFKEEGTAVSASFKKAVDTLDTADGNKDGIIQSKIVDQYYSADPTSLLETLDKELLERSLVAILIKQMIDQNDTKGYYKPTHVLTRVGLGVKGGLQTATLNPDDNLPEGLQGNIKKFELAAGISLDWVKSSNHLVAIPEGIADLQLFQGLFGSVWSDEAHEDHVRFGSLWSAETSLRYCLPMFLAFDLPFYFQITAGGSVQFALGDTQDEKAVGPFGSVRGYVKTGVAINYFPKPGTGRWVSVGLNVYLVDAHLNNDSSSLNIVGVNQFPGFSVDARFSLF